MKFCSECGFKFEATDKFCRDCGLSRIGDAINVQSSALAAPQNTTKPLYALAGGIVLTAILAASARWAFVISENARSAPQVSDFTSIEPVSELATDTNILAQKASFAAAKQSGKISVYAKFIADYPESPHSLDAQNLAFASLNRQATAQAYKAFVHNFPDYDVSGYVGEIEDKAPSAESEFALQDEAKLSTYETYYAEPGNTLDDAMIMVGAAPIVPVRVSLPTLTEPSLEPEVKGEAKPQTLQLEEGEYFGAVSNGVPHGKGRLTSPEGYSYDGDWVHGTMTGTGIRKTDYAFDGSWERYEGEFLDGFFHGQGTMTASNENFQAGEWVKGYMHGRGESKFHFRDDSSETYHGLFEDGVYHGQGRLLSRNGQTVEGRFANGMMPKTVSAEVKAMATAPISMTRAQNTVTARD